MRALIVIILALSASLALAQQQAAPSVTLKSLTEKREMIIEKTPFSGWENGIELKLHVDGEAVKGARQYGMVKIIQATDDAGTDLTKSTDEGPRSRSSDNFEDIREEPSFSFGRGNAPKPTGFDFELKLPTPSARSAKTIKLIKGEMQVLVGGEKKIVQVKSIKQNFGKTLDDPALKQANITLTLIDPKAPSARGMMNMMMGGGDANKRLSIVVSGELSALGEVKVMDGGEKINPGSFWGDDNGKRSITYDLEKPLPDNAVLEIEVWPGQKKITVPFELKDVKLP